MAQNDSTLFKGKLTNKELNVYMSIDFYHKNLKVPGQEVFGEMPGYFGDRLDSRKWLITDADVDGKVCHLSIYLSISDEPLSAVTSISEITRHFSEQFLSWNLQVLVVEINGHIDIKFLVGNFALK